MSDGNLWDGGATDESDTERDGAFSYAGEVHAFAVGVGVGFAAVVPVPQLRRFVWRLVGLDEDAERTAAMAEAKRESWYALGGMAVGAVLGVVALVAAVAVIVAGFAPV